MGNPLYSSPSPLLPRRSARVAQVKAKPIGLVKSEILDLLDNPTPEKYTKLEPEVMEDLMVADKIRDLLYE
ncbi:hypothetical protein EV426DRAFT_699065 [Tirmania nivea]|nr:hypothetical protein EV426DRAFT_699065 [Tirmania nivea]